MNLVFEMNAYAHQLIMTQMKQLLIPDLFLLPHYLLHIGEVDKVK